MLIVGAGALGTAAASALASAGIGSLVLLDPDVVELSNLHRQLLHRTSGIGIPKVFSARERLERSHPQLRIEAHQVELRPDNVDRWLGAADFAIDATDGADAKYLVNDGALRCRIPFSHAGVLGFDGQALTVLPGQSACLRCLFPEPPDPETAATCQQAGILGPVAGVIGAIQAAEAVSHLSGQRPALAGRLLVFDARVLGWRLVEVPRHPQCRGCATIGAASGLAATGEPR